MKNYTLFEDLAKARSERYAFKQMSVLVSDTAEIERMRQAKELEADGYISLSECNNNNMVNNVVVVTIAGKFTDKGIDLIKEHNIISTLF